jgi:SPOR domain
MRWLFLFVLLLNIVYVVWQTSVPEKDTYADVSRLSNVEPIILIRELGDTEQDKSKAAAKDSVIEAVEIENDSENSETVASVDVVESEGCFTLGPFRNKDNLLSLKKDIEPYVEKAVIRNREEKEHTVHWVYIQPEKDRKSVIELGKRLKAKKIKDFYVIREGEKNNGISLGHFKDKERAFGLESKVKKLGFDVMVEPIYKSFEVFWLDYQLTGDEIPEAILKKYAQSVDKNKISHLSRDCET